MKTIFIIILLSLYGCQKEESKPSPVNLPEKVASVEDEIGSFKFISNLEGVEIKGDRISRQGDLTTGEDLKIVETASSKVIDEFPMKDWGKVGFKLEQNILHVYPLREIFEIIYTVKDKKVNRNSICTFKNIPDNSKFDSLIAEAKEANPDWETIISGLSGLATQGDKKSHDFFLNPDATAKSILKNTEDGGASVTKVLKILSRNGCKW